MMLSGLWDTGAGPVSAIANSVVQPGWLAKIGEVAALPPAARS
jgi:hypothetical protein